MQGSNKQDRLNVLFLPSWYPNEQSPVLGIFNREYVKAVGLNHNVAVIYQTAQEQPYRNYDDEGVRTIKRGLVPPALGISRRLNNARRRLQRLFGRSAQVRQRTTTVIPPVSPVANTPANHSPAYYMATLVTLSRYLWAGMSEFSRLRRTFRPDIIHVQVIYPAGLLGWAISRRYRVPMVLSENSNPFSMHLTDPLRNYLVRGVLKAMDYVCPVSHIMQRVLQQYGSDGPFSVTPNVVNTSIFKPTSPQQRTTGEVKRMLIVALLADYKGYSYLLEALGQMRQEREDFFLDIVGDGEKRAEYEQLVGKLGIRDKVRFHGLKSKDQVAAMMQACDFLVLASLSEGLVVVMLEALATGKPVLSTRWAGVEDVINERVGHLVEVADVQSLHDGLVWMLDHYGTFEAEEIARYAQDRYSYAAVGAAFDRVYHQVLAEN